MPFFMERNIVMDTLYFANLLLKQIHKLHTSGYEDLLYHARKLEAILHFASSLRA